MTQRRATRTTRRDFLRGRAIVTQVVDAADPERARAAEPAGDDPQSYLVQVGRKAMACDFHVLLNAGQHPGSTESALEALELVDLLEAQLTVYRDDSEISRLNRTAARGPQRVEPQLFNLLVRCVALAEETGGAFDITSAPLSKAWGFFRREGRFPGAAEIEQALQGVGSRRLELDPVRRTLRFGHAETEINLGSIGKGYALDRCARLLADAGVENFLMHGGRSSILARGSRMRDEADGWSIGLRHPQRDDVEIGTFRLRNEALATSGCGNQFFHFGGRRYGHIIDPRSGVPADGVLSATVVADNAAEADALATAFFVSGAAGAREYCERRAGLAAVLVVAGDRAGAVEIQTYGDRLDAWEPRVEPIAD